MKSRLALSIALVLACTFARVPELKAQAPTLVNKYAKMKKSQKVKDEKGKKYRLKRRERVLVVYERGEWYWVKNKKGQQAWVLKKFVNLKDTGKKPKPKPKPKAEPVPEPRPEPQEQPRPEPTSAPELELESEPVVQPLPEPEPVAQPQPKPAEEMGSTALPEALRPKPQPAPEVEKPVGSLPHSKPLVASTLPRFKKPGRVSVLASEIGARVRIDGRDVGKAPIRSLSLKGGMHSVTVEKSGFVASSAQVMIDGGDVQLALALVPTSGTRESYESDVFLWQMGSWAGLGVGGLATLAGLGVVAYGQMESSAARQAIYAFNEKAVRTDEEFNTLTARRDSAATLLTTGEVVLVTGLVISTAGIVASMLGADPDRYAAYE